MKKYKNFIAIDFDSTLSYYFRPWEHNKFGKPIKQMIKLINSLYDEGYYVYIFTGRLETPELYEWLKIHKVKYHSVNNNPHYFPYGSRFKPYFTLAVDDKAMNPMKLDGKYKSFNELKKEAKAILKLSNEGKEPKFLKKLRGQNEK